MTDDRGSALPPARRILELIYPGGLAAQAVYAAARLNLGDLLANGPRTVDALAGDTGAHAPSLARLLRALTSLGVFVEDDDGRFQHTEMSQMLVRARPDSAHPWAVFLGSPFVWRSWNGLYDSIMTGQTAFEVVHGETFYEHAAKHPEDAEVYDTAMNAGASAIVDDVVAAYNFSDCKLIVDVGAGRGALLSGILSANPGARGILFDLPSVVARVQDPPRDVAERMDVQAGDAFESVPAGGDLYLLKSVIHSFDDQSARAILRNCRAAMQEHGRLILVEVVLRGSNEPAAGNALMDLMMLTLVEGHERTAEQFRQLLDSSGFRLERILGTSRGSAVIEATPAG